MAYKGSQAESPYYVMTDPEGNVVQGNVTFPGDPYTYQDVGSGKLRVISGPTQRSVGAVISRPDPSKKQTPKKDSENAAAPELDSAKSDKRKQAAMGILMGLGYTLKAASGMWQLKEMWIRSFRDLGKDASMQIKGGVVGDYFTDSLADSMKAIELGIDGFLRTGAPEKLQAALKIAIQPAPEVIEQIEAQAGDSPVRVNLARAKAYFNQSSVLLDHSSDGITSKEAKGFFETAKLTAGHAAEVLGSQNTRDFIVRGISVDNTTGVLSRVAAGGAIPSVGNYTKPELDRLVSTILNSNNSSSGM